MKPEDRRDRERLFAAWRNMPKTRFAVALGSVLGVGLVPFLLPSFVDLLATIIRYATESLITWFRHLGGSDTPARDLAPLNLSLVATCRVVLLGHFGA